MPRQKIVEDKKREVMSAHSEGLEKREDIGNDLLSILSQSSSFRFFTYPTI